MSNVANVNLFHPFKRGEKEITHIELRKPTAGDLRGLKTQEVLEMDMNSHVKLIPRISELTEKEFLALDVEDVLQIQNEVALFFVATRVSQVM